MSKLLKLLVAVSVLAVSSISFAKPDGGDRVGDRDPKGAKMYKKMPHKGGENHDGHHAENSGSEDMDTMSK